MSSTSTATNDALVSANSLSSALPSASVQHAFVCTAPDCRPWGGPSARQILISLSEALNHHCVSVYWANDDTKLIVPEFTYSTRASAAIKHILTVLKLSPTTTTTTELDKLRNLFICCKCNPRLRIKDGKPHTCFEVLTWREAVCPYLNFNESAH